MDYTYIQAIDINSYKYVPYILTPSHLPQHHTHTHPFLPLPLPLSLSHALCSSKNLSFPLTYASPLFTSSHAARKIAAALAFSAWSWCEVLFGRSVGGGGGGGAFLELEELGLG